MTIKPRSKGYQVTVTRASALPGFRKIRRQAESLEAAQALELEIEEAIRVYGKWPVEPDDTPLPVAAQKGTWRKTAPAKATPRTGPGTLRGAAQIALDTHYQGMRWGRTVGFLVWPLVSFFEQRGKLDLDDIVSADVDALVAWHREQEHSASYINQVLGILRTVNQVAIKRDPPLATKTVATPHVKGPRLPKWWLRPELHEKVTTWLRQPGGDPLFADVIDIICFQGLRIEETLRLSTQCVGQLHTDAPWLYPDGRKTADASNALPIYPEAVPVFARCIERAEKNRWELLFPLSLRQTGDRWNNVREYLGVTDIPTSTMKCLRRTFAWYANSRGMPTATLQKVLRHRTITTTSGYLDLVGGGEVDASRKYFEQPAPQPQQGTNVGAIIQAYAMTPGVTPEAVARFAKELMV